MGNSGLQQNYLTLNSGFVTKLNKDNMVVSNSGGTETQYINGELQKMVQNQPIFKPCHEVCIDHEEYLYIPEWNAGKVYPYKLSRI